MKTEGRHNLVPSSDIKLTRLSQGVKENNFCMKRNFTISSVIDMIYEFSISSSDSVNFTQDGEPDITDPQHKKKGLFLQNLFLVKLHIFGNIKLKIKFKSKA